jgi:hypothetical protein
MTAVGTALIAAVARTVGSRVVTMGVFATVVFTTGAVTEGVALPAGAVVSPAGRKEQPALHNRAIRMNAQIAA